MNLTDYSDRLNRLSGVVFKMEDHGVPIDVDVCHDILDKASHDAAESQLWLEAYAGAYTGRLPMLGKDVSKRAKEWNWNYSPWLQELLHGKRPRGLGLPKSPYGMHGQVKPGETTVDGRALEWLAATNPEHREFLNRVRAWRRQAMVVQRVTSWLELALRYPDGSVRLHPSFGMANDADDRAGAKTGRFGVKNPPLQQVPHNKLKDPYRVRRAFIAPPGKVLVVADYSQLEVVILAHLLAVLFGDESLAKRLEPGMPDLHSATAQYVFGTVLGNKEISAAEVGMIKDSPTLGTLRDLIKAVRYGLNYRKGAWGFGSTLFELDSAGNISGPPLGEERSQQLIDALYGFDPGLPAFHHWVDQYVYDNIVMPSLLGRWFPFPWIRSLEQWQARRAGRQAANWPMQAGGQEITAAAMIKLDAAGFDMGLQVHDELHFYIDEDDDLDTAKKLIREIGETAVPLRAPLAFKPGHGANWEIAK